MAAALLRLRGILLPCATIVAACLLSFSFAEAACPPTCAAPPAPPLAIGLQVSPLLIDVKLKPGQAIVKEITLRGIGANIDVKFQHADFGFRTKTYERVFIEDDSKQIEKFSTRGWFSVENPTYPIAKDHAIVVPLTIHAPADAVAGTHLGAAFFVTTAAPSKGSSTRVVTSARTGPLVFVRVTGGKPPKPKLNEFSGPHLISHGPIKPTLILDNDGAAHYRVSGSIKLSGRGTTKSIKIPTKFIMPGVPRTMRNATDGFLNFKQKNLPMGLYKLKLDLTVRPSGERITATHYIWVVAWWARVVLLALFVGVAIGAAIGWRRFQDWRYARLERLAAFDDDDDDDD